MISTWNEKIKVERQVAPKWDHGRPVDQAPECFFIQATVQRLSAREVLLLPESQRTREIVKVYTSFALQGIPEKTNINADVIVWGDAKYEVSSVEKWQQKTNLTHYKATALKIPTAT